MTILEEIKKKSRKVRYDKDTKLIVVVSNATKVMEMLNEKGYVCDNNLFGHYPKKADALAVFYDAAEESNKGYLVIPKEAAMAHV